MKPSNCIAIGIVLAYLTPSHGGEILMKLAKQPYVKPALKTNAFVMVPPLPPTNVFFRAIVKSNYPPVVPPRTSVLAWDCSTAWNYFAGKNLNQQGVPVPVQTWLVRSTDLKHWTRITAAVTPLEHNSMLITNVWPQYIRAAEGFAP